MTALGAAVVAVALACLAEVAVIAAVIGGAHV
jgi:hypothetical protein